MIDFTDCPVNRFRAYGGANGNKINIVYDGHSYMLKFPPRPSRSKEMSYSNSCISEYVACTSLGCWGLRCRKHSSATTRTVVERANWWSPAEILLRAGKDSWSLPT